MRAKAVLLILVAPLYIAAAAILFIPFLILLLLIAIARDIAKDGTELHATLDRWHKRLMGDA